MKTKSQQMQRWGFKILKRSAEDTGTKWAVVFLTGFLWVYCHYFLGMGHSMITVLFAGGILNLLLSLRDKLALQYLKNHPEALTDSVNSSGTVPLIHPKP